MKFFKFAAISPQHPPMFRKQDFAKMDVLLHLVFFLPIKNVLSCLDGEDMSLCLFLAFITSCHFMLFICISLPTVTHVDFTFFDFLPYVYLSMLKISVVLKRGIFKDWKKKSSGFKCRNLFPILYSREYVASLDQFGGDILISFIYLFLPYGEKPKLFFATHYLKLCWRFIKYFFKLDYIQS